MKFGSVSIGGHMVGVIALGFVLIGFIAWASPTLAQAIIPLVIAVIGQGLINLQKQTKLEDKVAEVQADQVRSIGVSTENAHAIAAVAAQQGHAIEEVAQKVDANTATTESVHEIVNSRDTELRRELAALREQGEAQRVQLTETRESLNRVVETLKRERQSNEALITATNAPTAEH